MQINCGASSGCARFLLNWGLMIMERVSKSSFWGCCCCCCCCGSIDATATTTTSAICVSIIYFRNRNWNRLELNEVGRKSSHCAAAAATTLAAKLAEIMISCCCCCCCCCEDCKLSANRDVWRMAWKCSQRKCSSSSNKNNNRYLPHFRIASPAVKATAAAATATSTSA